MESYKAFEQAIEVGVLSIHPSLSNYAGDYNFISQDSKGLHFEHMWRTDDRQYVTVYRS